MSTTAQLTRRERPAPRLGDWKVTRDQESSGSDYPGVEDRPLWKGRSTDDQNPKAENQAITEPKGNAAPKGEKIRERLKDLIMNCRKGLKNMYGETEDELNKSLEAPTKRGEEMARKLVTEMGCSREIATDLTTLTLYDVAILISDSNSMIYEQNGKRKETLIQFIDHITEICSMANESGILAMRFMNGRGGKKNWTGKSREYLDYHNYGGATRIGTELKKKILDKFATGNPGQIKPLLVLTVTDSGVEGEKRGHLKNVIRDCANEREGAGKGFDAVRFQFTRIGNGPGAAQLLVDLGEDRDIREYIDVLPVEFDLERLLADKWFMLPKILLGAILPEWGQDEIKDLLSDSDKYAEYTDSGDDWADTDELEFDMEISGPES